MADDVTQRISTEGADPLLFAGVNDANLLELQRTLGIRVSFRGDAVSLTGTTEQLERATPVVQGLLDLARMGEPVSPDDVVRLASEGATGELPAQTSDGKTTVTGYVGAFNQTNVTVAGTLPNAVMGMPLRLFGDYVYNWQGAGDDV